MTKIRRHVGRYLTHPAVHVALVLVAARGNAQEAVALLALLAMTGALPGTGGGPHRPAG